MYIDDSIVTFEECLALKLRTLYQSSGFRRYKMSKFEEYDLYAANKDFLVSDNVISFTDTTGKLMALKPDVTLSLVRKCVIPDDDIARVYYDENVYRVSGKNGSFQELRQTGVECLGQVDDAAVLDTLLLADSALACVSDEHMLVLTNLDLVAGLVASFGLTAMDQQTAMKLIGDKNAHELTEFLASRDVPQEAADKLRALLAFDGASEELPAWLAERGFDAEPTAAIARIVDGFAAAGLLDRIRFDFSLISDPAYYNGIVFQGFVQGVPATVLSGGQYDRLMRKLGKRASAVGFAVYCDALSEYEGGFSNND